MTLGLWAKTLRQASEIIGVSPLGARLTEMSHTVGDEYNGLLEARTRFVCDCGCGTTARISINGRDVLGRITTGEGDDTPYNR